MIITEVRRRRRSLYQLVLDGEPAMTVDVRTFEESPYRVGSSLSDEDLKGLLDESQRRRAQEKALYLLSLRDHSRVELERKLGREADEETAARMAERMEELGLVNDEKYARQMARDLVQRKHYPCRRAVQELCARGVARDTAQNAVEELEADDICQALELLRKKHYNRRSSEEGCRKAAASLARFGFGGDVIRRAMDEWQSEEQDKDI